MKTTDDPLFMPGDGDASPLAQYGHILPADPDTTREITVTLSAEEMAAVLFAYDYIHFSGQQQALNGVMAALKNAIRP